jgi:FkbM family methyltransferase
MPRPAAATSVLRAVWRHPSNRGRRARQLAQLLRFQAVSRFAGRPAVVDYGDRSRLIARNDAGSSRRGAYFRFPDWPEMQAWRAVLRPGDLFVDVGANAGLYSVFAAELGCEVLAVEPIAASIDQVRANLALNGAAAEVLACALADEPGTLAMAGADLSRQALRTVTAGPPAGGAADGAGGAVTVAVRTLDDVLGDRTAAGLKIDVEGAERLVVEGGRQAFGEQRVRLVQLEWNATSETTLGETREPLARLLDELGYGIFRPDAGGRLVAVDDAGYGPDVFAAPR